MRKIWLLASAVLAFLNFVKSQEVARTLYSTRYDNLDIDTILGSNRLVSNYVDCLLSRKPCPPEGKDLKRILPEALRTKCARCSPIQKENALKIITRLYLDYPDQYRALRERWDPSGEYNRRFEEYLRGLQFNQIGGNGGTTGSASSGGGSTVEGGGNDRPVRNDLDRQPATQSSNVQAIVIEPTLAGQPSGNVNTLLAIVPPSATPPPPPPLPPSPAVAAATERPRPPAPVAQILFPTTTDTTNTTTTTSASTTFSTTTSTTSTSNSGPLELTSMAPGASIPPNTDSSSSSSSSSMNSPPDSTVASASAGNNLPDDGNAELNATATAGPVVPVPVNYYLNITNGGSLTLWMVHFEQTPQPTLVAPALEQSAPAAPLGTARPDEVPAAPLWLGPQLAQQTQADRAQEPSSVVVQTVAGAGDLNLGNPLATRFQRPAATTIGDRFDELPTASPPVVVNRFGDDEARPSYAPAPAAPPVQRTTTTTTPRPTTTVRQTRPVTRQTTSRNTQRTTTRFITRVPQTPPPTPPRTVYTTRTSTIQPQRPPQPQPAPVPPQPSPALHQRPIPLPQAPQAQYPTIIYERPSPPPPPPPLPPQAPPRVPPQALPPVTYYVPAEPAYGGPATPDSIIDHFFVPPSQAANPQPLPIVGLWNQLGTKIADTADAIAGMLKKTVDVLVTSHIQSHQRALRRS
uniref:Uncharacterized protein n=1 Tax=Anopheles dirus TaxID=7168 RepID=A0A182NU82_9DIPT